MATSKKEDVSNLVVKGIIVCLNDVDWGLHN